MDVAVWGDLGNTGPHLIIKTDGGWQMEALRRAVDYMVGEGHQVTGVPWEYCPHYKLQGGLMLTPWHPTDAEKGVGHEVVDITHNPPLAYIDGEDEGQSDTLSSYQMSRGV